MKASKEMKYKNFLARVADEMMSHRIIRCNEFCSWFSAGDFSLGQLRHFAVQFSVFSNLFLVAQLKKMINSIDLEEMHKAKEILANELGCIFKRTDGRGTNGHANAADHEEHGDPQLVSTQGTVDGGTFKFQAAHFEWLLKFGASLDLKFEQMGKRSHGTASTLFFCDELERLYGNENYNIAAGASYAVENWAAAGFWKDLSSGLRRFRERERRELPLGFFTWHDKVEDQHRQGTHDELRELFFTRADFSQELFMKSGLEMLDGVAAFWDGLERDRLGLKAGPACTTGS